MKIALDYDDTFTRDKPLWAIFIHRARGHGHDIRFVTFRNNHDPKINNDIISDAKNCDDIPILFTSGQRKRQYCYEQGFMVDVWIDDMPELIVHEELSYVPGEILVKEVY